MGDEITSLSSITNGTKFIISDDGTKVLYFYNSDKGANEIKNANVEDVPASAYCYFTLEKYDGSEVSGNNIYWIKITDADGNVYPYGSDGGSYLNTIVGYGNVVISALKAGWGGSKSSLFSVTYDAEKGFSFQSVWKAEDSGKSWLAIGNEFVATQQYLTLYSKGDDPLAPQKAALESAINLGGKYSSFAKTTESWNALQDAISDGEDELDNSSTTTDRLTAATTAINDAIAGLKLKDGYTNLTKGMANKDVDYVLFSSTGLAYGTGGVDMNTYAELNEFDQLIILASAGKPRFCMNRKTADGQIGADLASSNMIDINTQGDYAGYTWATDKYQTIDGNKYTVDLNLIAEDWNGLAKLHCIKGANYGNVTVTDMLLYRTINVGATGYATFGSLYKNAKPNGVTAYAAKYEDGQVTLKAVTNVPADKGVVIMGAEGSYAPTFDVAAGDIDSDLKVSDGTVVGDESTIYVLANGASGIGFYLLKSGNKLAAGKAYLEIPANNDARGFIGIDEMGPTGVNEVKVNKAVAKTGKIYNLNGQIVSKPTKGLFIIDGKVVSF